MKQTQDLKVSVFKGSIFLKSAIIPISIALVCCCKESSVSDLPGQNYLIIGNKDKNIEIVDFDSVLSFGGSIPPMGYCKYYSDSIDIFEDSKYDIKFYCGFCKEVNFSPDDPESGTQSGGLNKIKALNDNIEIGAFLSNGVSSPLSIYDTINHAKVFYSKSIELCSMPGDCNIKWFTGSDDKYIAFRMISSDGTKKYGWVRFLADYFHFSIYGYGYYEV